MPQPETPQPGAEPKVPGEEVKAPAAGEELKAPEIGEQPEAGDQPKAPTGEEQPEAPATAEEATPVEGAAPPPSPEVAATLAETVTRRLEDAGFEPWEIISFAAARRQRPQPSQCNRVAKLLERSTLDDLRALAYVLDKAGTVLTDGMVKKL